MSQHPPASRRPRPVDLSTRRGVVTAGPWGPAIGQQEAPLIAAAVIDAIDRAGSDLRFLVLDLGRVTFLNSTGLGMCIDLRNRANALDASTVAVGLSEELVKLFALMKVDRLIEIVADEKALVRRVGK